jgi:OmpA-OmpF porin, OOP family
VERIVEREVVREVERPVPDTDGDGVNDGRDRCPDTPSGLRVDASGCVVENQAIELRGVTFEFNQSRLTPNAQTVLDHVARAFTGQASLRVEIAGHTDSVGSPEFNERLSQRRADAVRSYLIFRGASQSQLGARGYGESQLLIDPEKSDDDRERNRRVEFRVVEGK